MNYYGMTGNLTKDAEIKQVGDSNVINFSIANNDESKKDASGNYESVASFFNCTVWSKSGKIANHLKKGKMVTVNGALKQERWEKDGVKNSRVVLRCSEVLPHVFESVDNSAQNHNLDNDGMPF